MKHCAFHPITLIAKQEEVQQLTIEYVVALPKFQNRKEPQ